MASPHCLWEYQFHGRRLSKPDYRQRRRRQADRLDAGQAGARARSSSSLDDRRLLPQRSLPAKQERDLRRQGRVAGRSADRAGCDDRQRQSRHAGRRPPQAADGGRPRRTAPGQVQGQRLRTAARRSPVYSSQNSRSDPAGRRHANLARAAGLSWLGQPGDDSQRAWAGRSQTADPRRSPRIGAVARAFGDPGWRLRGFGIRTGPAPLRQPGLDRAARKTIARPRRSRYRRRRGTTDARRRDRRAARLATRPGRGPLRIGRQTPGSQRHGREKLRSLRHPGGGRPDAQHRRHRPGARRASSSTSAATSASTSDCKPRRPTSGPPATAPAARNSPMPAPTTFG